jgi:serine protease
VVDSGITEHADLEDSLIRASNGKPFGFDFVSDLDAAKDGDGWDDDPSDPGDFGPTADSSWHGTSVAGLISASRNSLGITGVAPNSRLVSVRAVGSKGGKISDLLAAVNWAAGVQVPNTPVNQHPARIINLSISSEVDFACEGAARSTFSDLRERGVVVVVAAGNRGLEAQKSFPASCSTVLVVAASTFDGQLAGYSNRGRRIDIAAPGGELNYLNPPWAQGLVTTSNSGLKAPEASSFRNANGTSLAAPLVSGVVALMLEVNPKLTPTDVKRILRSAVKPFAPSSFCRDLDVCGPGILDAAAAVELAAISGW